MCGRCIWNFGADCSRLEEAPDQPGINSRIMMALVPFSPSRASRRSTAFDGLLGDASVLDLLDGFRRLLLRSAIAIAIGILVGFSFTGRVVDFVLEPTVRA